MRAQVKVPPALLGMIFDVLGGVEELQEAGVLELVAKHSPKHAGLSATMGQAATSLLDLYEGAAEAGLFPTRQELREAVDAMHEAEFDARMRVMGLADLEA